MLDILIFAVAFIAVTTLAAYALIILQEKKNLKNKMIIIQSVAVDDDLISKISVKEFTLDEKSVRAGDEIKIKSQKGSFSGIFVGADLKQKFLILVNKYDEIMYIPIEESIKIKIISKYGKFLHF